MQGTDGKWYISYGDIKHEKLKPYRWELLDSPYTQKEPIILTEGEADADALVVLGFVSTDYKSLTPAHVEWFKGRDCIVVEDRDPPSSATSGGGYGHAPSHLTPGERHAQKAMRLLAPVAKRFALFKFPGAGVKDARDWVRAHPGSDRDKADILQTLFRQALAQQEAADPAAAAPQSAAVAESPWICGEFWNARKWHRDLRLWALGERISPDAALGVTFARRAAAIPAGCQFDTGIAPLSGNYYAALFGHAGDGKSLANRKMRDADQLDLREFNGLPSGEGLLDAYMGETEVGRDEKDKPIIEKVQTEHSALFFIDDADILVKAGRRRDATLFGFLEIAFFGDDLRTVNSERTRKRHVKDYALSVILGVQPSVSAELAREHGTGLPQRFAWHGTRHPEIGKGPRIRAQAPLPPALGLTAHRVYRFERDAMDAIDDAFCNRPGEQWWFQHYLALRCKWSVLLAITSGRQGNLTVTMEDWALSEMLWNASLATLQLALSDAEEQAEAEAEKRMHQTIQTAVSVAEARADAPSPQVRRVADRIIAYVEAGETKWRAICHRFAGRDKHFIPAARDLAIATGRITINGPTVRLCKS